MAIDGTRIRSAGWKCTGLTKHVSLPLTARGWRWQIRNCISLATGKLYSYTVHFVTITVDHSPPPSSPRSISTSRNIFLLGLCKNMETIYATILFGAEPGSRRQPHITYACANSYYSYYLRRTSLPASYQSFIPLVFNFITMFTLLLDLEEILNSDQLWMRKEVLFKIYQRDKTVQTLLSPSPFPSRLITGLFRSREIRFLVIRPPSNWFFRREGGIHLGNPSVRILSTFHRAKAFVSDRDSNSISSPPIFDPAR